MPSLYGARMRHAEYYIERVSSLQLDLYMRGKQQEATTRFQQELPQFDTLWLWLKQAEHMNYYNLIKRDQLIVHFVSSLRELGATYYAPTNKSIPQYLLGIAAAQRLRNQGQEQFYKYEGLLLHGLASIYADYIGDMAQSVEYFQQALIIHQATGSRDFEANSLASLAHVFSESGDPLKGIEYAKKSLPLHQEVGNKIGEAVAWNNLADAYIKISKTSLAASAAYQALSLAEENNYESIIAYAEGNLGSAYYLQGEYSVAHQHFTRHLDISIKIGDARSKAIALVNIGASYHALGQIDQANTHLNEALVAAKFINNTLLEVEAYNELCLLAEKQQSYMQAVEFRQKSINCLNYIGATEDALVLQEKDLIRLQQLLKFSK